MAPSITVTLPQGVNPNHSFGPLVELVDELQELVHPGSSGQASVYMGDHVVDAGDAAETSMPIMLRCEWPIGAAPRHAVLWVKPSLTESDLGAAINTTFQLVDNGGVLSRHNFMWGSINPFQDNTLHGRQARSIVTAAVGSLHCPPRFNEIITMLGVSMNGIVSVSAEPMEEARKCKICRTPRPYSSDMLERFRRSYNGVGIVCDDCRVRYGDGEAMRMGGYAGQAEVYVLNEDVV